MDVTIASAPTTSDAGNLDDQEYDRLLERMLTSFPADEPVFTTNVDPDSIWKLYLDTFPEAERQYHNCSACRQFIQNWGGLVTISRETGEATPIFWQDEESERYGAVFRALAAYVRRIPVGGVFLTRDPHLGRALTGPWRHFSALVPSSHRFSSNVVDAHQAAAAKGQDFQTVLRALDDFPVEVLDKALPVLESGGVPGAHKVLGAARWLADLARRREAAKGYHTRRNLVWRAVALAPAGYCHPRSSLLGTVLDDVKAGKSFAAIRQGYAKKVAGDRYQRPVAAPTAGQIQAAEALFEKLGLAPALERRLARFGEVKLLWRPTVADPQPQGRPGLFGHLTPKGEEPADRTPISVPPVAITWVKFEREVLPRARELEIQAPPIGSYVALTTAVHADAPPILQWDREDDRNPVCLYEHVSARTARDWSLVAGAHYLVRGIALMPWMWGPEERWPSHFPRGVVFLIQEARDTHPAGACLFPETLRSELHGVRATIEAHSKSATMGDVTDPAVGLRFGQHSDPVLVRVGGVWYRIDRWD